MEKLLKWNLKKKVGSLRAVFTILLLMLSTFSCVPLETKVKKLNLKETPLPYRILKTDPAFWQKGDSVIVSLEAVFDSVSWLPGTMELFLPSPRPGWIDSDTFKLLWVPDDSLRKINPPIAKVIDGFMDTSYKYEIIRKVEFKAIKNNKGLYHFQRQEPQSVIDTIYYD